jgi:cell division protease FtsH
MNEAAILAARRKKPFITLDEISASIERLVIGLQGKELNRVKARQLTAFHEVGRAFLTELINEEDIQKITIVPRGNNSAITLTVPSSTQYNSKQSFLNKIFVSMGGRAAEHMVYGLTECTTRSQRDITQLTRILRNLILRYALSRLQPLKQQAQRRNLFLLGSDVKQELTNIIDNFTTSFADIVYHEVLSFLQLVRPGGDRLVDELLTFEELDGTNFKNIAKESIFELATFELLWETEESSFFSLMLKKIETELKEKQIKKDLEDRKHRLLKGRGSSPSLPLNY